MLSTTSLGTEVPTSPLKGLRCGERRGSSKVPFNFCGHRASVLWEKTNLRICLQPLNLAAAAGWTGAKEKDHRSHDDRGTSHHPATKKEENVGTGAVHRPLHSPRTEPALLWLETHKNNGCHQKH